jgi:hypothetical protein
MNNIIYKNEVKRAYRVLGIEQNHRTPLILMDYMKIIWLMR